MSRLMLSGFSSELAKSSPLAVSTGLSSLGPMNSRYNSTVLDVEIIDHVATVWLNRPEKLNAISRQLWDGIPRIFNALDTDDEVHVIILAGRGRASTVGIDLEFLSELGEASAESGDSESSLHETIKYLQAGVSAVATERTPVIAAIHGHCLGAGMALATAADIRLAADSAVFSVREVKLGIVADVGTIQRLPGIVSAGHVAELLMTGNDINAARAVEIGLVNHGYPDAESLHEAAATMANEIAANPPAVVAGIKHVLAEQEGLGIEEALEYMASWSAAFLSSNSIADQGATPAG